ncbi:hypothetical protein BGX29_002099 [Mortierella sp. GBA35]|nr:hypothetical protein BGX29_002099 [Mortierella sp. GBA35]
MIRHFGYENLDELTSTGKLPTTEIDDAAVIKSIRCVLNNGKADARKILSSVSDELRNLLEGLYESLGDQMDGSKFEFDFVAQSAITF